MSLQHLKNCTVSGLQVSTMTISFKTNLEYCQVDGVSEFEPHLPENMCVFKPRGKHGEFPNCVGFKAPQFTDMRVNAKGNTKSMSIMLFNTGMLNITGVTTLQSAQLTANRVCLMLDKKHGDPKGSIKIRSTTIQMINTNFVLEAKIYLDVLFGILVKKYKADVSFDREVHPGILWKYAPNPSQKHKVTIGIFSSGKIIMTNLLDASELETTFMHVTRILDDVFHEIWDLGWGEDEDDECRPKKRGRKRKSEKEALLDKLAELAS